VDRRIGRFPSPDHAQVFDILLRDLGQRRIAGGGISPGIGGPFALRQRSLGLRQRARSLRTGKDVTVFVGSSAFPILATVGGLVEHLVKLNDKVKAGQKVAISR